ncbi:MAG: BMP family ABC transporter substrate-binding protein [Cyanobacteria bacterium P01_A01_bin.45]
MERRQFLKYATLTGAGFTAITSCTNSNNRGSQVGGTPGFTSVSAKEPLKVGFVYIGPVADYGWTYSHDLGRRVMEENLRQKVKTTFFENVNEQDAQRVIRQLAADGNKLIFTTSFNYMNPTVEVARDFPDVAFENCGGYKILTNLGTYLGRFEQARYLTGMIAGKMTKSNIIGFVGAYPISEVIRSINAFTQGLRATNPQAKVKVVWIQSWYNRVKEKNAAIALFDSGADILTQHTDSAAVVQYAKEKGIYAFGYSSDMSKFAPNAHLAATVNNWGNFYTQRAIAVLNGNWKSVGVWHGIAEQMVDISSINSLVPQDVQKLVTTKREQFINGTAHPFDGPLKDQSGKIRVEASKVLEDDAQLDMNWYVEGVEGSIPSAEFENL